MVLKPENDAAHLYVDRLSSESHLWRMNNGAKIEKEAEAPGRICRHVSLSVLQLKVFGSGYPTSGFG